MPRQPRSYPVSQVDRVERDPAILSGKPVIRGTRVPVHIVLGLLGAGYTTEEILDEYPQLEEQDVLAAIRYASQLLGSTDWFEFGVA